MASKRPATPPAPKGQTYMLLTMMLMLFIMIDPSLSAALGAGMSILLNPSIGFGGQLPVISILLAGALTGLLSTGLRHWSSDYVALERGRLLQRSFQKEMSDARLKRDVDRVSRLRRAQPFVMSRTMEANYATMKPAIGTMVVALAVFGWMRVFLFSSVTVSSVSLPWASEWPLGASIGFPNYILLYMVMSLPLTLVIGAGLKLWRYRSFDPSAPLKEVPTVEELMRRAEGEIADEKAVKRESKRARDRLRAAPAGAEVDDEVEIAEADEDLTEIVEAEGEDEDDGDDDAADDEDAEDGAPAAPERGPITAKVVEKQSDAGAPAPEN